MNHCPQCGCVFEKARSRPQHNRFMALADACFNHWPESHQFRPRNVDHLRYWLTMQAGRFDVVRHVRVHSVEPEALQALLTSIMAASEDARLFIDLDGDLITVRKAHSIKFRSMPQREFAQLCDDVEAVISAEGMDPQQLLRETASAA